ncbi:GDSL esterase/lipase At5g14450-like [Malania oleifera]|uniref:GDSL esterase/lipase At5g14450-like n=1 Tax=Malania oleifera TaxID=397392 RepID=UPI0025AEBFD7|nr:GDSL esterase/lipase At5g14450-like [Malania oleifera]XP_057948792.1 GDSL esterase/lipase At5g14450-like [Malania oleifera]XP_057948793.1 GDSL esterase/lipase At5g14450-like [Malania oleifera]XP_057948794.1 GDSL esterase/lipase At5g14450-like [Malania oleifera]
MEWGRLSTSSLTRRRWKGGSWALRKCTEAVAIGVFLGVSFSIFVTFGRRRALGQSMGSDCDFRAIFNFGDSNSDTGSDSAVFCRVPSPNGDTFFGKPSGRYSDGRLIIDFMAEELGLPHLSSYLDSIGTNFQHGANFAASGSTIQPANGKLFDYGFNPISLNIQLLQFIQFKERTHELYNREISQTKSSTFPRPEDFSKALYTMDAGQNDLHAGFLSMAEDEMKASIPLLINQSALALQQLYEHGARTFWVQNTGPIGCLPYCIVNDPPKPDNMDQSGCIKSYNEVAQEFNRQLKERVFQLRTKLQDAVITYVDIFSAKYSLISNAKKYGFVDPLGYCCGHHGDYNVDCGKKTMVNGSEVYGAGCSNPGEYISWDGVHYTEAANRWVANLIVNGSLSDPPVSISRACQISVHTHS